METRSPMQRIIEAKNYSLNESVQLRHALNDPYTSMARQEARIGPQASSAADYAVMYDRERSKAFDRLHAEYLAEIRAWDWNAAKAECANNAEPDPDAYDDDAQVGRCFVGSILNTYPSGKIYAPWTTNQTDYDELRDEAFQEALETVADENGGWIECESGDVFYCESFSETDPEEC